MIMVMRPVSAPAPRRTVPRVVPTRIPTEAPAETAPAPANIPSRRISIRPVPGVIPRIIPTGIVPRVVIRPASVIEIQRNIHVRISIGIIRIVAVSVIPVAQVNIYVIRTGYANFRRVVIPHDAFRILRIRSTLVFCLVFLCGLRFRLFRRTCSGWSRPTVIFVDFRIIVYRSIRIRVRSNHIFRLRRLCLLYFFFRFCFFRSRKGIYVVEKLFLPYSRKSHQQHACQSG